MSVKHWVEPMLRAFGAQKRRAMTGLRTFADGATHEDGWPPISVGAFAREGGITGGGGTSGGHYAEVYTGDGLTMWRIYQRLPFDLREIIFAHFVATGDARAKARELNVPERSYWARLGNAYFYIAGQIDAAESPAPTASK